MANPEHVEILKQGVEEWNQWRKENPNVKPDLSRARFIDADLRDADLHDTDLRYVNLRYVNLNGADLSHADLNGADLSRADLSQADLSRTQLIGAQLIDVNLSQANLTYTDLSQADLSRAQLIGAHLIGVNLSQADLSRVNLKQTYLSQADLSETDLNYAVCEFTVFADVDLSTTKGLDTAFHRSPSILGVETLFRSKGKIPEIFLRGCGVPETLITFLPSMLEEAIVFYSCFISYSHGDKEFAKRLHDRLQGIGIRCWLDEHQLNPGDKLHETIYAGIRVYDKVILCCSETAIKSWWVKKEFENMIAKEEDYQETLLIPLSLDNYLFEQSADEWLIGEIRKKRLVQSFVNWKDHDTFEAAFEKVVKALRTDGGKPPPPTSKLTPRA